MLGKRLHFKQLDPAPDPQEVEPRPPPKLARRAGPAQDRGVASALRARESALFRPVRSIGVVVDALAISVAKLGDASFVTASVGRGFQVFETEKLRLAYISPRFNEKVRAMTSIGEVVITALKRDIVVWQRLTELGRFRGHHDSATVLCTIGSSYLLSAAGPEAIVWQLSDMGLMDGETLQDGEQCILGPLARLQLQDFGDVSCIRHPPTYLNKVLLAGTAGKLHGGPGGQAAEGGGEGAALGAAAPGEGGGAATGAPGGAGGAGGGLHQGLGDSGRWPTGLRALSPARVELLLRGVLDPSKASQGCSAGFQTSEARTRAPRASPRGSTRASKASCWRLLELISGPCPAVFAHKIKVLRCFKPRIQRFGLKTTSELAPNGAEIHALDAKALVLALDPFTATKS